MFQEVCSITSNEKIAQGFYRLIFKSKYIASHAVPGQFVHVKHHTNSTDPLLRRPISINDINNDEVSMIYKVVGKGTQIFQTLLKGDKISVLGPLGTGFPMDAHEKIILIGGGVGIAPLVYLAKKLVLQNKEVYCFLGARTKNDAIEKDNFLKYAKEVFVATENGEIGHKGFVTDLLKEKFKKIINTSENITVYSCGPDKMLNKVGEVVKSLGVKKVYVSMENRMGCGVGVCLGCVVDTVRGKERVCKEGPVFLYDDIIWENPLLSALAGDHQVVETPKLGVSTEVEFSTGSISKQTQIATDTACPRNDVCLSVSIGKLIFKNPVITASGTFGYGTEYKNLIDVSQLGGITVKGISLKPWEGNKNYRLVETPSGLINAIGLQNMGVDDFIKNKLPVLKKIPTNVIVNISEHSVEGYKTLAFLLSKAGGISAIEVNISCPNIHKGGIAFGTDSSEAHKVLSAVRAETDLPIIAKLTPNVTSIADIAKACESAGADAVSLVNTFKAMVIDIDKKEPVLGNKIGGLSGPAIRPIAVRMVCETFKACKIPIIGMGGIMSGRDAVEFILAGATLVACGTGTFVNPNLPIEVVEFIKEYMIKNNFNSVQEMIGLVAKKV